MSKKILQKKDMQMIGIMIVIGFIIDIILDNGMEIASLLFTSYACHRGLTTVLKNSKEYKNYIFFDEQKYNNGLKKFIIIVDIYIVIRIFSILMTKYNGFTMLELLLVLVIFVPYESYLGRKYIKNIRDKEKNIERVLIKNKTLVAVILAIFIGFTMYIVNFTSKIKFTNHMNFLEYEYKLTYDEDDKRVLDIKTSSHHTKTEETNRNTEYFEDYIITAKKVFTNYVYKIYAFVSMTIMFILVLTQCFSGNKEKKTVSILSNLFLVIGIIFAIIALNPNLNYAEQDLNVYINEYLE